MKAMKKLMFVVGCAAVLASCNDRAIKPSENNTPDVEAREAACRGHCDRVDSCFPELGMEGVEDMDACIHTCLTEGSYFTDRYETCWDEALAALECLNALSCDEWLAPYNPEYDQNVDGRYACSGTHETQDPGPMTIHGNCIANVNADD